jgi:hypothetical protein
MNIESKLAEMVERLNLQSIGEFIQHGSDVTKVDRHSFAERYNTAYKHLERAIENICGKEKAVAILEEVVVYAGIREDKYFSLGMKAGAQITIQLTNNMESDF